MEWVQDLKDFNDPEILKEETYFTMINQNRKSIKKGGQAYYCYGDRSNMHLLSTYGFCLQDNLYDSLKFMVKLDKNYTEK